MTMADTSFSQGKWALSRKVVCDKIVKRKDNGKKKEFVPLRKFSISGYRRRQQKERKYGRNIISQYQNGRNVSDCVSGYPERTVGGWRAVCAGEDSRS